MKIDVTTKNDDGSISFNASLNKAEVNTLLQYAVNNLMAMGYVFDTRLLPEDDDTSNRFQNPKQEVKGTLN